LFLGLLQGQNHFLCFNNHTKYFLPLVVPSSFAEFSSLLLVFELFCQAAEWLLLWDDLRSDAYITSVDTSARVFALSDFNWHILGLRSLNPLDLSNYLLSCDILLFADLDYFLHLHIFFLCFILIAMTPYIIFVSAYVPRSDAAFFPKP